MPHATRRLIASSAALAGFAYAASWLTSGSFDDPLARVVLCTAFASWVAVGSGITGFILAQLNEPAPARRRRFPGDRS